MKSAATKERMKVLFLASLVSLFSTSVFAVGGTTANKSIGSSCCVPGRCVACTASYVSCPAADVYKEGMDCTINGMAGSTKNTFLLKVEKKAR